MKFWSLGAFALLALVPGFAHASFDGAIIYLPPGQVELTDVMTPEEIFADMLKSGDPSELDLNDLDAASTGANRKTAKLYIQVSKELQHLWVYEEGRLKPGWDWDVSTGTEQVRCPPEPADCRIAHTPTGLRHPGVLDWEHYSSIYANAPMHRAVQFVGGIYLHATYGEHLRHLGKRDSGGCVRQAPANAERLFLLVKDAIAKFGREAVLIEILEK